MALKRAQVKWQWELTRRVNRARAEIGGRIAAAAANPRAAQSMAFRNAFYDKVSGIYDLLSLELNAWGLDAAAGLAQEWHKRAIQDIRDIGDQKVKGRLIQFDRDRVRRYWELINPDNKKGLAGVFTDKMKAEDLRALRTSLIDVFRQQTLEGLTANQTQKALQTKWGELAGGIADNQFVDRAGRKWENARYLQMLTRTTATRLARETYSDTLIEAGFDLVKIINVGETCPICEAWDGVIVSLTGKGKDYPGLNDAYGAGWGHPNCDCYYVYVDADVDKKDIERQAETETPDFERRAAEKDSEYRNRVTEAVRGYKTGFGSESIRTQPIDNALPLVSETERIRTKGVNLERSE
jgi:hypothetical protein